MVIPVEQTCPVCGDRFMGSDMVGLPCMNCTSGGLLDETLLTSLAAGNIYDSINTNAEVQDDESEAETGHEEGCDPHDSGGSSRGDLPRAVHPESGD